MFSGGSAPLAYAFIKVAWRRLFGESEMPRVIWLSPGTNDLLYKNILRAFVQSDRGLTLDTIERAKEVIRQNIRLNPELFNNSIKSDINYKTGADLASLKNSKIFFIDDNVSPMAPKYQLLSEALHLLGFQHIDFGFLVAGDRFKEYIDSSVTAGAYNDSALHTIRHLADKVSIWVSNWTDFREPTKVKLALESLVPTVEKMAERYYPESKPQVVASQAVEPKALIKSLQKLFGAFGETKWYTWLAGPAIEEHGLFAYPLIWLLRLSNVIYPWEYKNILDRIRKINRETAFLGYRGLPLIIGSFLYLISPVLGIVALIVLNTWIGLEYIMKHPEGKRGPPIVVTILASIATILPFTYPFVHPYIQSFIPSSLHSFIISICTHPLLGILWLLGAPTIIHSIVNIIQTIRGKSLSIIGESDKGGTGGGTPAVIKPREKEEKILFKHEKRLVLGRKKDYKIFDFMSGKDRRRCFLYRYYDREGNPIAFVVTYLNSEGKLCLRYSYTERREEYDLKDFFDRLDNLRDQCGNRIYEDDRFDRRAGEEAHVMWAGAIFQEELLRNDCNFLTAFISTQERLSIYGELKDSTLGHTLS
ncbi:hypothetical protein MUO65_02370, partial [bacterium]|nr:hypothetical protein [bacterium]